MKADSWINSDIKIDLYRLLDTSIQFSLESTRVPERVHMQFQSFQPSQLPYEELGTGHPGKQLALWKNREM